MVLAEQHEANVPSVPVEPVGPLPFTWPTPANLRQSVPILRLLAEIWAIPEVSKIGLTHDEAEVQLWVFIPNDDRKAQHKVFDAERTYLNATPLHTFSLLTIPRADAVGTLLPPFETILER